MFINFIVAIYYYYYYYFYYYYYKFHIYLLHLGLWPQLSKALGEQMRK